MPAKLSIERAGVWAVPAAAGLALLWAAWRMDAAWFDRHILPTFFVSRATQWDAAAIVRVVLAAVGLALALVAGPLLARAADRVGIARICAAAALALVAGIAALGSAEAILHLQKWQQFQARRMHGEPQRQEDSRLGWLHVPSHAGDDSIGGRTIGYAFDSHGYRVASPGAETDLAAPSILFSGESVMLGFGLEWSETIPARVASGLDMQPAVLAVTGYSTDQSFLRLRTELSRFTCPVAVVSIFMPSFLDRNMNTDRPHLDGWLRWHSPTTGVRIVALARNALAYRSRKDIERGIGMTAAVLRASDQTARSHGARPILVVPAFLPESAAERTIRHRVLDDRGIGYLFVPLDPTWRIAGDDHPDPRAAQAIAAALASALRPSTGARSPACGAS